MPTFKKPGKATFVAVAVIAVLVVAVMSSLAQEQNTEIKRVPPASTSPASGREMFVNYCAPCHGKDAKGNGPAAAALKQAPANLTELAKENGGKFPDMKVSAVLRGEAAVAAHGTQEMPVWGPVFWRMSQGRAAEVQQRITNLTRYLKSLQEK
ncbi:MAG TPA: c-type cytochrome [Terriglobales bacterium]|nr:c-type cytochrome [Terriglobales bacterium]